MKQLFLGFLVLIVFCSTVTIGTNVITDDSFIPHPSTSISQGAIGFHFITPFDGEFLSGNITVTINASLIVGYPVELRWDNDTWIDLTDWFNVTSQFFEYPLDVSCLPTGNVTFEVRQITDHGTAHDSVEATIKWYRPPILVVCDYYNASITDYYTDALEAIGFTEGIGYSIWNIPIDGSPSASDLLNYQFVIWFRGDDAGTFPASERTAIQTYLGDLTTRSMLLTGTETAWAAYQYGYEAWLSYDFGVNDYIGDGSNTENILGVVGFPYEGTNYTYGGSDGSQVGGWAERLRTMEFSAGLIEYTSSGFDDYAATQSPYVNGIFFGFAFDAVSTSSGRIDLMNKTLNYFGIYNPPQVNILSPLEDDLVNSPLMLNWESTSGLHPIIFNPTYSIFVDGQLAVSGRTSETYPLPISEGNHTIRLVCTDNYGQRSYDYVSVEVDATEPSNEFTSHTEGSILKSGTLLEFNITDVHLDQVVAGWDSDTWVSFSYPYQTSLPIDDGAHVFHVNSSDTAGNWNYTQFTLICDDTLPAISLTSLSNGTVMQSGSVVQLDITDTHLDTTMYHWDMDEDTPFVLEYETSIPVVDGSHDLIVNATDIAGNQRVTHYQFITDDADPIISLLSISNHSVLQTGTPINFEVSDSHYDATGWFWDSSQISYASETTFETYAPAVEGEHWLYVYSNDSAGNTHYEWYMFVIDNTVPMIILSSPDDGGPIGIGASITIDVQDIHLDSVYFKWDLGGWDEWSSPYTTTAPVEEGLHTLFVNATDTAGNWIQVVFVFHVTSGTISTSDTTTTSTTGVVLPVDLPTSLGILGIGIGLGVVGSVIVIQVFVRRKGRGST